MTPSTAPESGRTQRPEVDFGAGEISNQTVWRLLSRGISEPALGELRDRRKWHSIIEAAKTSSRDEVSADLLERTFAWVGKMPVALIRALDEQKAWESLTAVVHRLDQKEHLYFQTSKGLELTKEMLLAVHREERGREGALLRIMAAYDGHPDYLRTALDILGGAGNRNPYAAFRGVQAEFAGAGDKPTLAHETQAVGASGGPLENYISLFKPGAPAARFVAGYQGALKPCEAFSPETFGAEARAGRKSRRAAESNEYLQHLTLDELLESPEKAGGSRLLVRALEVYKELLAQNEQLRGEAAKLAFRDSLAAFSSAMSDIRSFSGGRMMTWLREHARDESIPAYVRRAFATMDDTVVQVSKEQRKECLKTLVDYYLENVAVVGKAAVQPLIDDAHKYAATAPGELKQLIEGRLAAPKMSLLLGQTELRFHEVAFISAQLAIVLEFRAAQNQRVLERYSEPLARAITIGRRLFQDCTEVDGDPTYRLKSDSYGPSIPLERLGNEAVEAARISTRAGTWQKERIALFNRHDFAAIRDLLLLDIFAPSDALKVRSQSTEMFERQVRSVAIAVARAGDFYAQLEAAGHPMPAKGYSEAELAQIRKMKEAPTVLGRGYSTVEQYEPARFRGRELKDLLDAATVLRDEQRYSRPEWVRALPMLKREASAGLLDDDQRMLSAIANTLHDMAHRSTLEADLALAAKVAESEFCGFHFDTPVHIKALQVPAFSHTYFSSHEVGTIRDLAALQRVLEKLDLPEAARLKKEVELWNDRVVISGRFAEAVEQGKRQINSSAICFAAEMTSDSSGRVCRLVKSQDHWSAFATIYDPGLMREQLDQHAAKYTPIKQLPAELLAHVREILEKGEIQGPPRVGRVGLLHDERDLLAEIAKGSKSELWISTETIASLKHSADSAVRLNDGVLVARGLELEDGEPVIAFKHAMKGESLFAITSSFLLWIADHYRNAEVREIATKVYQLRNSRARDQKEQFKIWIGAKYPQLVMPETGEAANG